MLPRLAIGSSAVPEILEHAPAHKLESLHLAERIKRYSGRGYT